MNTDKIIFNNDKNLKNGIPSKRTPAKFIVLVKSYNKFLQMLEKSSLKNSPAAYMSEIQYLELLVNAAEEFNLKSETEKYTKILREKKDILKEKFSIKIQNE